MSESFSYLFYNSLSLTSTHIFMIIFFFNSLQQIMLCFNASHKTLCIMLHLLFSQAVYSDLHKKGKNKTVKLFCRSLLSSKVTEVKYWNKFQMAASFKFSKE